MLYDFEVVYFDQRSRRFFPDLQKPPPHLQKSPNFKHAPKRKQIQKCMILAMKSLQFKKSM